MADISYGRDISVSLGAAATVVEAFGLLEKLLVRQNGQPLPRSIIAIRDDLKSCLARAATDAATDALTPAKAPFAHGDLGFEHDVKTAAERLNITESGVRDALRTGRLGGRKVRGQWLISDEDIAQYAKRKVLENVR